MIKEGYIARWNKYPKNEIKIRVARPSILAPSKTLLTLWKNKEITWDEYTAIFRKEIQDKPEAIEKLKEIKQKAQTEDVRLICYEKNPPCHRFILIEIINELLQ